MDMLKNKRYLALGGLVALLLAVFFPYYKWEVKASDTVISSGSVSLFGHLEGYVILICIFACALFIFSDFISEKVPAIYNTSIGKMVKGKKPIYTLIPIGIIVLVSIFDISRLSKYSVVKWSLGFYLEIIGVICLLGHSFLYKGKGGITDSQTVATDEQVVSSPNMNQQPMMNQQPAQPQQPMMNQQQGQPVDNNNQFPGNNGF